MSAIQELMQWYASQCDGDWEHSFGVKIETLDNPGWSVEIDTRDTDLEGSEFPRVKVDRSDSDWLHYWATKHTFEVACGPNNLEEALGLFLRFAADRKPPRIE